ncbi:MAG: DMT family transporter [Sphingobacteriia bacterium]|nr:MAG: DMT family transporter [Sphingobacteriia bacterium]
MRARFQGLSPVAQGILLALLAVVLWSGNFIIARKVIHQVQPLHLAFYRWFCASILLLPLAWKHLQRERHLYWQYRMPLFWLSLTGIALFNTFVYVAGHYTSAINMALIGTTSSPLFATAMAVVFLREKIPPARLAGMVLCVTGILFLLSGGSWQKLLHLQFGWGDLWVLAGAFAFAIYNVLVRKRPPELHPVSFLWVLFFGGTVLLLPFVGMEAMGWWQIGQGATSGTQWDLGLVGAILYLGAGTSVVSFLSWNGAIQRLGAARTVLFGNLIPIFASVEAVWLIGETMGMVHFISGGLVILGLALANASTPGFRNAT